MQEKKTLIEREIIPIRLCDCVPVYISYDAKIVLYDLTKTQVFMGTAGDMPLKYANMFIFGIEPYLHIAEGTGETTAYIKITVMNDKQKRYGTDYQTKASVMYTGWTDSAPAD